MVFGPLDARAVEAFDVAFDFDHSSVEDGGGAADFDADLFPLRVVLDEGAVGDDDLGAVGFEDAAFGVAGLPVLGLVGGAHGGGAVHDVVLGHDLLAVDLPLLDAPAAAFRALGPFGGVPFNGAVEDVAVLSVRGRGLGAHVVGDDDGVAPALGDFVDAVDFARLDADPAGLGAGLEVGVVPTRGAGVVVAGADEDFRFGFRRAHVRGGDFLGVVPDAVDDQFLDAA